MNINEGPKKRILIVDDDIALSSVLGNSLKLEQFEIAMAADGQYAMDLIENEKFDLILLDLSMPWFDGFHVLEDLKNKNFKTPVIVMSNLSSVDDINKAKALGAVDYLVKASVTPAIIVKEVEKFLAVNYN